MLTTRAVDGSSRVRFVPKPNSTLQLWVGKILTESAESNRIGSGVYRFWVWRILAVIWLDLIRYGRILWDLANICLNLSRFGRDLTRFVEIWLRFPSIGKVRVGLTRFLAKTRNFWQGKNKSSGGLGSSISQIAKLPLKTTASGLGAGNLRPTKPPVGSGESLGLGGWWIALLTASQVIRNIVHDQRKNQKGKRKRKLKKKKVTNFVLKCSKNSVVWKTKIRPWK